MLLRIQSVLPPICEVLPRLCVWIRDRDQLTIHARELEMPVVEVMLPYRERPEGSESKLSTVRDGFRIVRTILRLVGPNDLWRSSV